MRPTPFGFLGPRLGWIVLGLLGVQCVVQLAVPWFASGPWEVHAFRDDAYYQFAVARNLVHGNGFTGDGVHAAGGVQVLWTLLLALPALVFGSGALPVCAILLGTLLHLLSALLVVRLVSLFAPRVVAWGLAAFYASRPLVAMEAINGQETALALFVLLVWARRAVSVERRVATSGRGLFVWTILLPWARTDLLVFPAGLALWNLIAPLFGGERRSIGLNELALVASAGIYVLLQKLCFGAWLPPSGFAIPWLFHDAFAASDPTFAETLRRYWWYVRPLLLGGPYTVAGFAFGVAASWCALAPLAWWKRSAPVVLAVLGALFGARDLMAPFLAGVLLLFTGAVARTLYESREGRGVLGLWIGFVLLLVLHVPLRWYPRDYYFVPAAVCGVVTLAVVAGRWMGSGLVLSLIPVPRRLALFWLALLGFLPVDRGIAYRRFPWQEEMSFAARNAGEIVGEEAGIAAFNSGLLAWEHAGPVRNLDGVVDGAALPALREKQLAEWLAKEKIDWVLETPRQVADADPDAIAPHASGRYLGPRGNKELVPVCAFDLPRVAGHHRGTECQMLYARTGVEPPALGERDALLAEDDRGIVVLLPVGPDYTVERNGREAPLRIHDTARLAPFVVTRIASKSGRVTAGGRTVIEW